LGYNLSNQSTEAIMEPTPLKNQAEEIITAVDHDLRVIDTKPPAVQRDVDRQANAIVERLFGVVSDVDMKAAVVRAQAMKQKYPTLAAPELAQKLVRDKCQQTGAVGAVTAGASLIPGIGTAAAVTLGAAADIATTFKLQAEMVLEIAALYNYPLTEDEKQRLVMVITGLSAGTTVLARKAGQNIAIKAGEQLAGKSILKAIPVAGMIASAGTNVLSTYIIGQRADAYFRLGPEAVGTWLDSLRAISGVDEREIAGWLAENSKAAGSAMMVGAGKVAGLVGEGAKIAGGATGRGALAYFHWVKKMWLSAFGFIGGLFGFIWGIIAFGPRQIIGLFRRKPAAPSTPGAESASVEKEST
jgi:hypothetical protein